MFGLWTLELLIFDLKIGFLVKSCIDFTPSMYARPKGMPTLFLKLPCILSVVLATG